MRFGFSGKVDLFLVWIGAGIFRKINPFLKKKQVVIDKRGVGY